MAEDTGAQISDRAKEAAKEVISRHEHIRLVLQAAKKALELGEKDRAERLLSQELREYDRGFLSIYLEEEPEKVAAFVEELSLSDDDRRAIQDLLREFKILTPIIDRLAAMDTGYRRVTRSISYHTVDFPRVNPVVTITEYFFDTEFSRRTDTAQGVLADAENFVSHVAGSYERCQEAGIPLGEAGLEAAKRRLVELVEAIRRICAATGISEQDVFQVEAEAEKE